MPLTPSSPAPMVRPRLLCTRNVPGVTPSSAMSAAISAIELPTPSSATAPSARTASRETASEASPACVTPPPVSSASVPPWPAAIVPAMWIGPALAARDPSEPMRSTPVPPSLPRSAIDSCSASVPASPGVPRSIRRPALAVRTHSKPAPAPMPLDDDQSIRSPSSSMLAAATLPPIVNVALVPAARASAPPAVSTAGIKVRFPVARRDTGAAVPSFTDATLAWPVCSM